MITPMQVRAALAIFNMTKKDLGREIKITGQTIGTFARGKNINSGTLKKIEDYFRSRGLIFLEKGDDRNGGEGLRFNR